jgi:hypothetical protein
MRKIQLFTAALGLFASLPAFATPITFSGSRTSPVSGQLLAASVSFAVSGNSLVVTLTNTSTADVLQQPDILTAVFFNISGPTLTLNSMAGSAVLNTGSTVLFGSSDPGGVVGGEWGYLAGIGGALSSGTGGTVTDNYGISSSGFGVFGNATFPGSDLNPPPALDGVNYGITSAGDNPATGQSAVTGSNPLIQNSVVFTLPGLPNGFDPSASVTGAFFQYGTSLTPTDPGIPGTTPAPGAAVLLGLGGLAAAKRRRR